MQFLDDDLLSAFGVFRAEEGVPFGFDYFIEQPIFLHLLILL